MNRIASLLAIALLVAACSQLSPQTTHLAPQATIMVDGTTCTLADAITAANDNVEVNDCPAGSGADTLTLVAAAVYDLGEALPAVTSEIVIEGNGATVQRDSGDPFRIFDVAPSGDLTLNLVTVRNGRVDAGFGGGIRVLGALTLNSSTVSDNVSTNGGGIANHNVTTLNDSTVSGNEAITSGGYNGGGIWTSGILTLNNSTVSNNFAETGGGGIFVGSGIIVLNYSTVTANLASNTAGLEFEVNPSFPNPLPELLMTLEISSSIIAENFNKNGTERNCNFAYDPGYYELNDRGYNLVGPGSSCGLSDGVNNNIVGAIDPLLGPLSAGNGGPTSTHELLPGSPALDRIPAGTNGCGTAVTEDQRGVGRPQGSSCDIGAFERSVGASEAVDGLIEDIDTLVSTNTLKEGQATSLIRPLENAQRSLGKDRIDAACSQMQDFIDEVGNKVADGALPSSEAPPLTIPAITLRGDLGCY